MSATTTEAAALAAAQAQFRDIDELVPYARNARTHSAVQIDLIARSIEEFGFTNSVLADEQGIVAGHGRVMAARALYGAGKRIHMPNGAAIPDGTVPVVDCTGWDAVKRRAYILADNQLALQAGWNMDLLREELTELKLAGFDLDTLGFGDQLTDLIDPDQVTPDKDPDATPDVPEVAHSRPGDIWVLGPHKIICGDSTLKATWDALLGTELADLVMTDPPFGVSYHAKGKKAIANDDLTGDKLRAFLGLCNKNLFDRLKPGASLYMFHADSEGLAFRAALIDAGFKVSQCLTWVKDSLVLGRSRYQWRHEPCLLADKPGGKQRWWGGRKQTTVIEMGEGSPFQRQEDGRWAVSIGDETFIVAGDAHVETAPGSIVHYPKPRASRHHPTQKPVVMLERLMKNSARAGDLVLEPFSGSGSTLVAAERLGMYCRAVELDPGYVDVACRRYFDYTGRVPVHAVTGEPFPVEDVPGFTESNP